jgi:CRISPR-associated endonuclease/helicase Cas3
MVADLGDYNSHPDKLLVDHVEDVVEGTRERTDLDVAELAAIFHDVGKLNPNFQDKLKPDATSSGYAHHSYLSALAFLCYFLRNKDDALDEIGRDGLGSVLALIAHHHGDLPNFPHLLSESEVEDMIAFLREGHSLPGSQLVGRWHGHTAFSLQEQHEDAKELCGEDALKPLIGTIENPLRFFLETQWGFASLIAADKADAAGLSRRTDAVDEFCSDYGDRLNTHLASLPQDSELNRLRTRMREEACRNIRDRLDGGRRVFSLAAPTGAGKTFMMLALAREIIERDGPHRLIYALPFLSITEQVEDVTEEVFGELSEHIRRVDSKGQNERLKNLQEQLEGGDPDAFEKMRAEQFATETFDHPFIITTFVRLFEALVSNRNAELLKLPNFQQSIFLIDEIQALPPRLYGFFVALLDAFCEMHDAYAVISTATMPNFELLEEARHDVETFFPDYEAPPSHDLLSAEYFDNELFDRYRVEGEESPLSLDELAGRLRDESESVLVILSTIDDTRDLYKKLEGTVDAHVELLNTHFTPEDRRAKIERCDRITDPDEEGDADRVILISTQLIEAGVDISFPVLYRDVCPVPSVVQSAGRCNRNGEAEGKGRVVLFELRRNEQSRANLIYRGRDKSFLDYARQELPGETFDELELLDVQRGYFDEHIHDKTLFGVHFSPQYQNGNGEDGRLDFITRMKEAHFEDIGEFELIDSEFFGEEYQFYVPGEEDWSFEQMKGIREELIEIPFEEHEKRQAKHPELQQHLRGMADRIIQVRISKHDTETVVGAMVADECMGIRKLRAGLYDRERGLQLSKTAII